MCRVMMKPGIHRHRDNQYPASFQHTHDFRHHDFNIVKMLKNVGRQNPIEGAALKRQPPRQAKTARTPLSSAVLGQIGIEIKADAFSTVETKKLADATSNIKNCAAEVTD